MKELYAAAGSEFPWYDGCMQRLVIATHFFCHNYGFIQVLPILILIQSNYRVVLIYVRVKEVKI